MIEILFAVASVTDCQVGEAYDRLFGREPVAAAVVYWSDEPTVERLIERLAGTPEGSVRDWAERPEWWPHIANDLDAECPRPIQHPAGWVDLGHGVYGPAVLLDIRWCESRDSYTARNPRSSASGAYQFLEGTARWTARMMGRPDLIGYGDNVAGSWSRVDQDRAAVALATMSGLHHWNASGRCW